MASSFLPPLFPRLKVVWLVEEVVSRETEGTNRSGRTRPATVQILATCRMKRSHERLWDHVTRSKCGDQIMLHQHCTPEAVYVSRVSLLQFMDGTKWQNSPSFCFLCSAAIPQAEQISQCPGPSRPTSSSGCAAWIITRRFLTSSPCSPYKCKRGWELQGTKKVN